MHHVDVARATSALYAQARKLASLEFSLNGLRGRARSDDDNHDDDDDDDDDDESAYSLGPALRKRYIKKTA